MTDLNLITSESKDEFFEALSKSIQTGLAHYYSRSRKKLWKKGETSGMFQRRLHRPGCEATRQLSVSSSKQSAALGWSLEKLIRLP